MKGGSPQWPLATLLVSTKALFFWFYRKAVFMEFSIPLTHRVAKIIGYWGKKVIIRSGGEDCSCEPLQATGKPSLKSFAGKMSSLQWGVLFVLRRCVLTKGDDTDKLWSVTSIYIESYYELNLCKRDMKELVLVQSLTFRQLLRAVTNVSNERYTASLGHVRYRLVFSRSSFS